MVLYNCKLCEFSSKIKTHYNRHLKTKKHVRNIETPISSMVYIQKHPKNIQKSPQNIQKHPVFKCDYCKTVFTLFSNKRRHELHRCKENNIEINKLKKEFNKEKKELKKQINLLLSKVGNTTINNTQNIQLNNYGTEDISHITDSFKSELLKIPYGAIPKMIEAVHFNEKKPENKNILLTNKNDNKIKIFIGGKWIYKNKEEVLGDLIDGKYFILDCHYENIYEKINNSKYQKFRNLFDEKDKKMYDSIMKECELILLNNR